MIQEVHNLIILDESGSMESIKDTILNGFNRLVKTIQGAQREFPNQQHFITFISFNSEKTTTHHFMDEVSKLKSLDTNNYQPFHSTPLYDAIGESVTKLDKILANKAHTHVLVTILTDGEENASSHYTQKDIKSLIAGLSEKNWKFTYIGTDHDVKETSHNIGIDDYLTYERDNDSINKMFEKESLTRIAYYSKLK